MEASCIIRFHDENAVKPNSKRLDAGETAVAGDRIVKYVAPEQPAK